MENTHENAIAAPEIPSTVSSPLTNELSEKVRVISSPHRIQVLPLEVVGSPSSAPREYLNIFSARLQDELTARVVWMSMILKLSLPFYSCQLITFLRGSTGLLRVHVLTFGFRRPLSNYGTYLNTDLDVIIEDNVVRSSTETPQRGLVNVGEILLNKLMSNPQFVGQIDATTGQKQTFGEMRDRSIRLALWLRKQGVQSGDVILLCSHNQMDNIAVLLAALSVGAATHPIYDSLNAEGARHIMSVSRPKVVFTNEKNAQTFVDAAKLEGSNLKVAVIGNLPDIDSFYQIINEQDAGEVDSFQCAKITKKDHVAVILSSSGTTGLPKGVACGHSNLCALFDDIDVYNMRHRTIIFFTTLAWGAALLYTLVSIYYEATRIVPPPFTEELLGQLVEKFQVDWVALTPYNIHFLLKSKIFEKYDLSSIKYILRAGCALSIDVADALSKHLPNAFCINGYGMTECSMLAVQTKHTSPVSCGQLIRNVKMKVVDLETGKVLGVNQCGELCFKSPTIMLGYYKNPEATREIIDEDGWLHSGDLGYYTERGELFVVDRIKAVIKYRNQHVSPAEVERVISSHPGVQNVVVVSIPNDLDEEQVVAVVEKDPKLQVSEQELIDLVASKLEDYKRLRGGVIFLDEIPRSPSGKERRQDLKIMARELLQKKAAQLCKDTISEASIS